MLLNNNDIMIYNKSLIFLFIIVPDYVIIETFRFEDKNDYDDEIWFAVVCVYIFLKIWLAADTLKTSTTVKVLHGKTGAVNI